MHREQIKELALANGFKLKQQPDGTEDLNPYVYEFAQALVDTLLPKASPGCFEVPRMCEIFKLPIEVDEDGDIALGDGNYFYPNNPISRPHFAQAAVYAINNHDSMRAASLMSARDLVALNGQVAELQRSCDQLEEEVVEKDRESDQLKAHIQRFMQIDFNAPSLREALIQVQRSTPEQSLAVNDADVVRAAITKTRTALHHGGRAWLCRVEDLEEYADQLLKQANEVQS